MTGGDAKALVIGGGVAGMEAAAKIGNAGYPVLLVEKTERLGGLLNELYSSFPRWENPEELVQYKRNEIENCEKITVMTNTIVKSVTKMENGFCVQLERDSEVKEYNFNAVVIATGFELFDASVYGEYGYGSFPGVYNSLEFEGKLREMASGKEDLPGVVAFFKCVGSRDRSKGMPYCSKICCMYTAKQAGLLKEINPDAKCYVFYMDYRAAGKEYEEFVRSVIEDRHVRYVRGRPAKVLPDNGKLMVRAEDTLMGIPVEIAADMIVLASAIVPSQGTKLLAEMFGAGMDEYGFVEHDTKTPVQAGDRVYFAGACGFAVESTGALQQGAAAAAEVISLFSRIG